LVVFTRWVQSEEKKRAEEERTRWAVRAGLDMPLDLNVQRRGRLGRVDWVGRLQGGHPLILSPFTDEISGRETVPVSP